MNPILRALMVEDNEDDMILVQETLRAGGYDVRARRADTEEALREALREGRWDIVLSDYCLPSFDARDTLRVLAETGCDLPVIVVSGTVGEDVAVETLKLGADDYLLKQNLTRLVPAVRRALDLAESRRRHRQVEQMKTIILENSLDLICTLDLRGRFLEISSAAKSVLGYEPAELTDVPFEKLVHPDELTAMGDEFQAVLRGRSVRDFACRFIHKSGRAVNLTWSIVLSRDEGVVVGVARDITERKQKDEALRRVEDNIRRERALLRALIDSIPDLIFFKDRNFLFLGCNRAFETYFGAPESQLIGRTDFDIIPHEWAAGYRSEDEKLFATGQRQRTEEKIPSSEGSVGIFDTIKTPFHGPDGELLGLLGVSRDITERKQKDKALRTERDFSNAVLKGLPGVFYHFEEGGHFVRWNRNFELVTGYTAEELAGMHALDFFADDEKERVAAIIAETYEKGESSVEADFLLKDGRRVPYLFTGELFEEGGRKHFIGVGLDMSERKRMEEDLRKKTAILEAQIESALDGILVVDQHGNVVLHNQRLNDMWKVRSAAPVGEPNLPMLDLVASRTKDPAGFAERIHWLIAHPTEIWRDIIELVDGVILDRYSAPVLDKEGNLYGRLWMHRDITEERRREKKLAEALASEKELTEQARAGERAKSEFLAVMSHEIRTPMNGILGFAELLRQASDLSTENREHVRIITESSEALLRILDDILDFSRLEAGRMTIENAGFSPRALLEDIRALLSRQAAKTGVQLLVSCAPRVPDRLEGDAGRLRQVLLNLAGNAIKFTTEGSIRIDLSPFDGRPATYVFSVTDTGSGIRPEEIERIFQPFTQVDSSISRRHGGTGLGLSISRRLAELLGGTLTAESAPGKGSVFRVTVPLADAPAPGFPPPEHPPAVNLDAGFSRRHPLRLLVVEDNEVNLKLIRSLVRRLGYDPRVSRNGREAVEIFREEFPDFVLMDLQMPEMDGIEATKEMRALEKAAGAKTPARIVALTADIFPDDRQRCFDAGMDGYLNKPVKLSALAEVFGGSRIEG